MKRIRRVLRPLGALAGITGAAAVLNRGLRAASAMPVNRLGGAQRQWTWRGHDVFVTEAGEGAPLILVHGIGAGASSFEFRDIFPLLATGHRVVAFDLLGCGLSAMPQLAYTSETFVDMIADVLASFGSADTTLVGSRLGAALAIRAAARVPHRIARLATICPTGLNGVLDAAPNGRQDALGALLRSPLAGETLFNGLASAASLRRFLRTYAYADPRFVTPDVVGHYYAVAHQPGARYVPAALAGGALNCNVARDLPFVEAPVLVIWGTHASRFNPYANASEFVRLAKYGSLASIANAGMHPHEEEPVAVAAALATFATPRTGAQAPAGG